MLSVSFDLFYPDLRYYMILKASVVSTKDLVKSENCKISSEHNKSGSCENV